MFLCKGCVRNYKSWKGLTLFGIKLVDIIGAVPFYPEEKKRFKSKIRKYGVIKDKPT
jgi:hypothetical protein